MKYKLTDETKEHLGRTLHRIVFANRLCAQSEPQQTT